MTETFPKFIFLLVSHNRRETTRRCVEALLAGGVEASRILLYDDASSDGTVEAVLEIAPGALVIRGDGEAFWNGGLHRAWTRALDLAGEAFVWLNDDVLLAPDALARAAAIYRDTAARPGDQRFILVGAVQGADGRLTYGGQRRVPSPWALRIEPVAPGEAPKPIDTFNGNFVVIPRAVVDEIGLNDPAFFHNTGDIDYGLRASKAGIEILLLPGFVGVCEINSAKLAGYGAPGLSLSEQWRKVNTHHGLPFRSWLRLTRRHSGVWFPLHFLLPYRRLVLPRWLLRMVERR